MHSPQHLKGLSLSAAGLLALIIPLAAFQGSSREEVPDAPASPILLDGWQDLRCAECHGEQAEEWAGSAHAFAWESPNFQAELPHLRRPARCHSCHAPEPLHLAEIGAKPRVRSEYRHLGVDCLTCHLGPKDTMLGPHGRPSKAHATARGDSFKPGANDLCIVCHRVNVGPVIGLARDFDPTGPDGRPRSCVGCHMEFTEREPRPDENGQVDEDALPRPGRSHRLRGPGDPAFLASAFHLSLSDSGPDLSVKVTNRAGHRLPGLQQQSFAFHAVALDIDGKVLGEANLTVNAREYLPAAGFETLDIPGAAAAESVHLTAAHHPHAGGPPVPFLDMKLENASRD